MNTFSIDGIIVSIGRKKSEKAPTPYIIKTEIKKGEFEDIPLNLFNDLNIGDAIMVTGRLSSFTYNDKTYSTLKPVQVRVFAPSTPSPTRQDTPTPMAPPDRFPSSPKGNPSSEDDIPF